jgi:hypothetical protein
MDITSTYALAGHTLVEIVVEYTSSVHSCGHVYRRLVAVVLDLAELQVEKVSLN